MQLGTDLPEISDADWERTPASVRRLLAALFERVFARNRPESWNAVQDPLPIKIV